MSKLWMQVYHTSTNIEYEYDMDRSSVLEYPGIIFYIFCAFFADI